MSIHRTPLLALVLCLTALSATLLVASQVPPPGAPPAIDSDDIGGIVSGPKGPEAGVEDGKGSPPLAAQIQLRPDPLAK